MKHYVIEVNGIVTFDYNNHIDFLKAMKTLHTSPNWKIRGYRLKEF